MEKKSKGKKYTSKGERPNVSRDSRDRKDISQPREQFMANMRRFESYLKGRRAYITIPNEGENRRREPFIRVLAKEHFNNTLGTTEEGKRAKDVFLANRQYRMPDRSEAEIAELMA